MNENKMSDLEYNQLIENMLKLNELLILNEYNTENHTLKYLNRTNSNTSCNSTSSGFESGYLSSNDSINNLSNSSTTTALTCVDSINNQSTSNTYSSSRNLVTYGYFGKAKNSLINETNNNEIKNLIITDLNNNRSIVDHVNHGDDVGFALTKTLNDLEYENIYYFGLADGVSANRLRGYDAKLFPNALLNSCANYIANNCNLDFDNEYNLEFLNNNNYKDNLDEDNDDENLNVEDVFNQQEEKEEEEEDDDDEEYNDDDFDNELGLVLNEICNNSSNYDYNCTSNQSMSSNEFLNCASINNECKYLYKTLLNAHNDVNDKKVYGSSTVCLLSLKFLKITNDLTNRNQTMSVLSTCNLGDSGYLIIRNRQVVFKSKTQTHRFNAPYQLGCTPPELLDHDLYRDKPEDCICHSHEIKPGDFILLSSDGLFDNLYEDEIALIIDNHIKASIEKPFFDSNLNFDSTKTVYNSSLITNDLLSSTCELLVQKASEAGIKRDDMLIILAYVN